MSDGPSSSSLAAEQSSAASMTKLPPSPDLQSSSAPGVPPIPEFSLDGTTPRPVAPPIRRLRSVARYQAFFPKALACSSVLSSYDDRGNSSSSWKNSNDMAVPSCLGAVAGPQGVALFRLSRPHVPLLILSHATNAASSLTSISSLAFEPKDSFITSRQAVISTSTNNSLYLAATRGSGVLVWDASGHSPNPLVGRVGLEQAFASAVEIEDSRLTSMCWKTSSTRSTNSHPLLATTSASTICLWDLRTPYFKPTTQFSTTRKTTGPPTTVMAPLVQVACARDSEEIATIDSAGIVQIYDVRKNDRLRAGTSGTTSNSAALSTFAAHETAGVGISYFGTTKSSSSPDDHNRGSQSRWLTWGLDEPMSSAVVKIWSKRRHSPTGGGTTTTTTSPNKEEDPVSHLLRPPRPGITGTSSSSSNTQDYALTAQCVRPNLACARVCIPPINDKFLAVGHLTMPTSATSSDQHNLVNGWWAELYSLSEETDDADNPILNNALSIRSFGLEKVAGFQGGNATNTVDKKTLMSVLGSRTELGGLQAAELSLTGIARDTSKGGEDENKDDDLELLLCCLSDTGVVSTHVIPEALPKAAPSRSNDSTTLLSSPPRRSVALRKNLIRTAFPATNQARVYPEDREGTSLADAASFWGVTRTNADSSVLNRGLEEWPKSVEKDNLNGPPSRRSGGPEGGPMPFDMDVPVAYGSVTAGNVSNLQIGITDISTGAIVSTNSMGGVVEEGHAVSSDPIMQKPSIMTTIETERVPCPRLCGAVFGKGNGGLVVFHNGEVKKMWNWYQRTDTIRLSTNPTGRSDPISSGEENLRRVHNAIGSGSTHPLSSAQDGESSKPRKMGPRTLKELMSMMAAAKEAQWGDEMTSDGSASNDILSVGDDFFEDESLGSNSSDSDDDDDDHDGVGTPPTGMADEMYKRYFGGQPWKSNRSMDNPGNTPSPGASPRTPSSPSSPTRIKKLQPFHGPSSDMLSPVVNLTRKFDLEMLGFQSIELAEGWELGPWDGRIDPNKAFEPNPLSIELEESKAETPVTTDAQGLPHYGYLQNSSKPMPNRLSRPFPTINRTLSEGNLEKKYRESYNANTTISRGTKESFRNTMNDPGGFRRGEATAVRPNMEESMKFFKKLFTQPQDGGAAGFSTALSPPDSPRRLFSTSHMPKDHRHNSTGTMFRKETSSAILGRDRGQIVKLGVYTLRLPKIQDDCDKRKTLDEIKRICLHNAAICHDIGDKEKEGVWNLLDQTVDRQLDEGGKQSFNGWGGNGGGALGVELVGNLLKYYEARGDCQMLATMVCVLSGGRRSVLRQEAQMSGNEDRPYLLPLDQDEKYDLYIRRYADLLYEWGLLSLRAELNKHLIRVPATNMNNDPTTLQTTMLRTTDLKSSDGRLPGIAVVFQCPKCGDDTEFNTNVCRKCRDFAFRCSICDNAIQGLFTVCDYCNHGGHVEHMTSWFANNVECPTGCGCACTFSPLMAGGGGNNQDVSTVAAAAMADNDALQDE